MTSLLRFRPALALLAVAVVAGCSSSSKSSSETTASSSVASTTAAASGKLDCTKGNDAVKAALGSLPTASETALLGVTSCEWEADKAQAAVNTATSVVYKDALDAVSAMANEPVAGLGDKAFIVKGFSSSTGGGTSGRTLWVVKGDKVYSFAIKTPTGTPTSEQLVALAKAYVG